MTLAAGLRLGPYEVIAPLGAGGMGEVYRARDTKLGRDVAIKIVSDGFAHDPERLTRFQREAHLLASLNHPHIAAIYDLEEANGSQFLVLELVEGETLAQRLKSGALPVSEALTFARQIADALQAAHERGIIHRDLKPANIAFTADGQVKVLDFGLAKALEPEPMADVSNSPTMTLGGTQAGVILGTAAYMAPEQAKGRPADKRSDVWAFGCVLYEMLTGTRAFKGEDVADTLAFVLTKEPDLDALPPDLPHAIRTIVRGCLRKTRKERIADISIVHFVLMDPAALSAAGPMAQTPRASLRRRAAVPIGVAVTAAAITMAGTAGWIATHTVPPSAPRVSRFLISPPTDMALTTGGFGRTIAITPDGTRVIYRARGADGMALFFVRMLDQLDAKPLSGLGEGAEPFVSPDGQWVGFRDAGGLKRVAISGGPAVTLTRLNGALRGASWGGDGTIVFATDNAATGLQRVDAGGGEPTSLTQPDFTRGEADHMWPELLPGGQAVLFTIVPMTGGLDEAQVALLDLQTGKQTTLVRGGSDAHYVSSGHLVYGAAGTLRAVAFDPVRRAVVGTPAPVVPEVVTTPQGGINVAVASDGTFVYTPGVLAEDLKRLVWVDRQGQETPLAAPPDAYSAPRLSPDGARVAFAAGRGSIFVWDVMREAVTRLNFERLTIENHPVWAPDGRRLFFSSTRAGVRNLFVQAADGTGDATQLSKSPNLQNLTSISPDGTRLVFTETTPSGDTDVLQLRLDGAREVTPLVRTPFRETRAEVSPDGRWLAYNADETGRLEIYVRPFPDVSGGRWQVSTAGGERPLWSRDARELFYLAPDALMRVGVGRETTWTATAPVKLFDVGRYDTGGTGTGWRNYDIGPDGRFLMLKQVSASDSPPTAAGLVVVQHFDEELKRLVPTR